MSGFDQESIAALTQKLQVASENVPRVYAAGHESGITAENTRIWQLIQGGGMRTDYAYAFSGAMWTDEFFAPKTAIRAVGACDYMLCNAAMTNIPIVIDLSGASSLDHTLFGCSELVSIERLILPVPPAVPELSSFLCGLSKLRDIVFEGTISRSGLDLSASIGLSTESIISLIDALDGAAQGCSVTLSIYAVASAFETSSGACDGCESGEWRELLLSKSAWDIVLKY